MINPRRLQLLVIHQPVVKFLHTRIDSANTANFFEQGRRPDEGFFRLSELHAAPCATSTGDLWSCQRESDGAMKALAEDTQARKSSADDICNMTLRAT
eukprot:CAMPEP_0177716644 /NCGR_PEP_ID=MMETSP0484_2-20121128/14615_1 /TAXON_ID=354590 /ORGANISM="Rhodomonas lens, Strain RHODO" /LENGTH=97 /DNA_ID=CAMNT_0019228679 /DNA_START=461 /DNA_END=751 /DNA_ORIENTATION=+